MPDDMLSDGYFKVSSSQYLAIVAKRFLADNWIWMAIPVVVCLSLAFLNVNFLIVALLLVCVAIPMLLALIYFYYILTLEASWSVVDKTIEINGNGDLLLHFAHEQRRDHTINRNEIKSATIGNGAVIVELSVRRYTFLVIPLQQFNADADIVRFLSLCNSRDL